jgi:hypothetical protein
MDNTEALSQEEYLEPETIRMLRGEEISSLQVLKDITTKIVKNTEAAFVDFYVFENIVHVLNDIEPDTEKLEGTTPAQIWYALLRISKMRPDFKLDHEVKMYIRFIYRNAGMAFLPPHLGETNPNLTEIIKRAEKGNIMEDTENLIEIQAIHYLRIKEYLKTKGIQI